MFVKAETHVMQGWRSMHLYDAMLQPNIRGIQKSV